MSEPLPADPTPAPDDPRITDDEALVLALWMPRQRPETSGEHLLIKALTELLGRRSADAAAPGPTPAAEPSKADLRASGGVQIVVVHESVRSAVWAWFAERGLGLSRMSDDPDDLPTYVITTAPGPTPAETDEPCGYVVETLDSRTAVAQAVGGVVHVASEAAAAVDAVMDALDDGDGDEHDGPGVTEPPC